jgi:RNHCP domain
LSHNSTEVPDEAWEETDAEDVGSAYKLRKQNRQRSRQQDAWQRLADEDEDEREEVRQRPAARRQRPNQPEEFRCRHCRTMIGPVLSGGRHRNHCPLCLHSRHVDERMPGDRLSYCGATMAPIGYFTHPNGEYGLVHQCLACGVKRHNRIAADDDFDLVLALPDLTQQMPDQPAAIVGEEEYPM